MPTLHFIPRPIRNLAAVSYIPLLGPIVFYGHRHQPFICFHSLQGTALSIYMFISYFIPLFGHYLALIFVALAVNGFIHAVNGENYRVPGLSDLLNWILLEKSPRHSQHLREIHHHRANINYLLTL